MTEGSFEGVGGVTIFTREWQPAGKPHGVVVISHGLNAHSGLYEWAAQQFTSNGLAVYALDHRGRGRSEGERFFVEKFSDWTEDLATFIDIVKSREPGLPVFLLGHSAGGVIASGYTLAHQDEIAGLIVEDIAYQIPAPDIALAILKGVSKVAPHAHVLKLKNEDFSRDPAVVAALNADPLIAGEKQPSETVAELVRADELLKKNFQKITLPLLILHGTAGQGDEAARQPGVLREDGLQRQDVEAVRRALPRPAGRHRQAAGDGGHPGLDRRAPRDERPAPRARATHLTARRPTITRRTIPPGIRRRRRAP
jgi:alpha-beta hydrolase superfamily lysophospholipase